MTIYTYERYITYNERQLVKGTDICTIDRTMGAGDSYYVETT